MQKLNKQNLKYPFTYEFFQKKIYQPIQWSITATSYSRSFLLFTFYVHQGGKD